MKKSLCRRERDSLEGPHEEAEKERKAFRQGKNLAFSEDAWLKEERVQLKVTPRKVSVPLKRRQELNKRRLWWKLAWWGYTERKEASRLLGLRERHRYSDQGCNQNRAPCMASTTVGTEWEEKQNGQIVSIKREQLTEKGREAGR